MNRDFHHRCRCTRQDFTFEEWCNYLEEDNPDIVYQYGTFCFNIFDICLTPNIKIDWSNKSCSFRVTTAQSDNGRWNFGVNYNFGTQGGCSGASYVNNFEEGYSTEKEAVLAALECIEWRCQQSIDELPLRRGVTEEEDFNTNGRNPSAFPRLKEALNRIKSYKETFNPRQLDLFDF